MKTTKSSTVHVLDDEVLYIYNPNLPLDSEYANPFLFSCKDIESVRVKLTNDLSEYLVIVQPKEGPCIQVGRYVDYNKPAMLIRSIIKAMMETQNE